MPSPRVRRAITFALTAVVAAAAVIAIAPSPGRMGQVGAVSRPDADSAGSLAWNGLGPNDRTRRVRSPGEDGVTATGRGQATRGATASGSITEAFVRNDALGISEGRQRQFVEVVARSRPRRPTSATRWVRVERAYGGTVLVHHCHRRGSAGPPVVADVTAGASVGRWEATEHVLGLLAGEDAGLRWVRTDVRRVDAPRCG